MSDRETLGHTFLRKLRKSAGGLTDPVSNALFEPGAAANAADDDTLGRYPVFNRRRRALNSEPTMVDPSDVHTSEAVRRAADARIRREAIRQLDSIDLDDDDGTIEPLPAFESSGLLVDAVAEADNVPGEEVAWDEIAGRFVPEDDCSTRE